MTFKLFGTDGVRGEFGCEPITPQTVLKLGSAIGSVLRIGEKGGDQVLIGKDTRISGYLLESALTCGLSAAGVDVRLLGPLPTPAVSYLTQKTDSIAGIVISASHNPYCDNGIKLFASDGTKLPDDVECRIEEAMHQTPKVVSAKKLGKVRRYREPARLYFEYIKSLNSERLDGLRIVLDCANGASYRVAPRTLEELGAVLYPVGVSPDGFNINLECGSTNPETVRSETLRRKADVGIALDGDGDRLIMIDEKGGLVNGDKILYILAMTRKRDGRLNEGVVGTHLTNIALEQTLEKCNIPFARVNVGDRNISNCLQERGWNLGGEESGHILNGNEGISGDGLITALEVLNEMVRSGRPLSELTDGFKLVPQVKKNIRICGRTAPLDDVDLTRYPRIKDALVDAEAELSQFGRILLRPSGTEPLVRILVEGSDKVQINTIANQVAKVVEEEMNFSVDST